MKLCLNYRSQCKKTRMFKTYTFFFLVFFFLLLCVYLRTAAAAEITVEPPMPLLNVPFQVTANVLQPGQVLFLSASQVCNLDERLGDMCTISQERKCVFNVSAASINVNAQYTMVVPKVYICSTAFPRKSIGSIQLHVIAALSRFVFRKKSQFVIFNEATPVGSVVGFFKDDFCTTKFPGISPVTLGNDRKAGVVVDNTGVLFVCARIPLKNDGLEQFTSFLPASTLLVVSQFSLLNTEALRNTRKLFALTDIDRMFSASFSRSKSCEFLLQEPVKGQLLNKIELPILVPKGEYYFCIGLEYYKDDRLYVPSENLVVVREYGIQPHSMYVGLSTTMTLTLDAEVSVSGDIMSVALFRSPDCNNEMIIDWNRVGNWVVKTSPGLYYACVKGNSPKNSLPALAANISVLSAPLSSVSSYVVRGLNCEVTLDNIVKSKDASIIVGLSLTPDCTKLVSSQRLLGNSNRATLFVPWGVFDKVSLCVSTPLSIKPSLGDEEPDRGYTYAIDTITVRSYNISYPPLFAGKKESITLDQNVALGEGTKGFFSKTAADCSNTMGISFLIGKEFVIKDVLFPEAGIYFMCVKLPKSVSYARIADVVVYGLAKLNPMSIVSNIPTDVSVSLLPPNAPLRIVNSTNCFSNILVDNVADKNGYVKLLQFSYAMEKKLTVCVGYKGSHSQSWSLMPVASLAVADVKVLSEVLVATQTNRVTFIVPDKNSLSGFEAAVLRGTAGLCNGGIVGPTFSVCVPDKGRAFILFKFPDAANWTVCLGRSRGKMKSVGEVTSMEPLQMTADPAIGAVGLPVRLHFTGPFLSAFKPTEFFVTDKAESCASEASEDFAVIYGNGSMNAVTGVTNTFVLKKEGSFFVCVGKKHKDGNELTLFAFGGTLDIVKFRSISRYVIRDSVNNLTVFPRVTDASLFLLPCSTRRTCAQPVSGTVCVGARERHYTSSLVPLRNAAVGQYVLCQEDKSTKAVVASEKLVSVLNPFVATILDANVLQHKPVRVRLSGGDVKTRREDITIFTIPQGVACNELRHAQREDFVFSSGTMEKEIVVTKIPPFAKQVQLCLKASETDVFSVATFDLLPYMTPAVIITDRKVQVRSGTVRDGILAKLTAKKDCQGNVMSHGPARVRNFVSELYVMGCADDNHLLTAVHYCESYDGGSSYEHRGLMSLIRLSKCGLDSPAAIRKITVPPARKIMDYGIDTKLLMRPMLSRRSDCKNFVHDQNGYLPQYDEVAVFYVCVNAKGYPSYVFTTETPTLRVENFKASPTSIYSRPSVTSEIAVPLELALNYPTGTTQTYLSHFPNCSSSFATAAGLANVPPRTSLLLSGEYGLKYVCAKTVKNEEVKAVALVLVLNPPTASMVDPALVRTAPFRATLQVVSESGKSPLYSLVSEEDSHFLFAPLFTYSFRGVFLSNDMCQSVLAGSDVVNVSDSGSVVLSTKNISTNLRFLSLCAGTPAGNLTVLSGIEVSSSIIFPSKFVLGADVKVYIPLSPSSVFYVKKDGNCGGPEIVPPFITNNEAYGRLSFKRSVGSGFLPEGLWTLCKQIGTNSPDGVLSKDRIWKTSPHNLRPLATIEAFAPVYYKIRGAVVVVGVPSVVVLLDDLKARDLLPGFSTDKSCKEIGESHGSWQLLDNQHAEESKRIVVKAVEPASAIYLCAVAPVNGSVVSVPLDGGLKFVPSNNVFPSTLSRCEPTKLASCVLPGSPPSGVVVRVIKGHCCDIAHRGNVVGQMTRTSDNKCSLQMDSKKLNDYTQETEFSLCAWDAADYSYCTTLGTVSVGNDECTQYNKILPFGFGNGALIAVLIFAVIFGVLLIVLLTCLVVECYRRRTILKEVSVATNSLRSGSEINPLAVYNPKNGSIVLGRGDHLLLGPNGSHLITGGVQPTITFTTSTDQTAGQSTSREVSPEFLRLNLWEGIENDERDQIALLEARAKYNLRLAFIDGLERIRLAEKERAVQFEVSDDEINQEEARNPDSAVVNVASAPTLSATSLVDGLSVGKGVIVETASAVGYAIPILFERDERASIASSHDVMNYTTTQRFFDDWRFTIDSEAVLRQRIVNWEDEDWHALVDMEFNSYLFLQQRTLSLPPPPPSPSPLPDAIVRPFAFLSDEKVAEEIECGKGGTAEMNGVPTCLVSGGGKVREGSVCVALDDVSPEVASPSPDVHGTLRAFENVGELSSMGTTGTSLSVSGRWKRRRRTRDGHNKRGDVSESSPRHHADPLGQMDVADVEEGSTAGGGGVL